MTESDRDQPASSIPHSDFFHGDVHDGLERMRRRLLDLTKRNKLLNYRYSKKGALRVVDELPDQLFDSLLDGKEFFFKPVPLPRGYRDRDNDERQADAFRGPTAQEHAATLGIATSFELPIPSAREDEPVDPRHTDKAIQTLHYPEDLEALLRKLSSAARLAIEETGTNMLYLAFGFLDWSESDSASELYSAPLLLLPVSLRKADPDPKTRAYKYAVEYSGEDVLANISLQELIRRDFGLELPDFEDSDTPEGYFKKLKPLFVRKRDWKLRRHVTLTLLSFGKLLMYRDLDPTTWPAGAGPADHARVREFFEGKEQEPGDFATDHYIDYPPTGVEIPDIVDEADSSQHSALADAMSGKSLVVAGPPGTGKSQTITNLVAASLARGKRVLFVSEKLAALEVVRHRLEGLGLGAFCLELHSHKSKKRALLDDIDVRLKLQGTFENPARLDAKLKSLASAKADLTAYVALVNSPFGAQHQRLFDIIWSAARYRRQMAAMLPLLTTSRIDDSESAPLDQIESWRQAVTDYADHLQVVSEVNGRVGAHPWFGVRTANRTFRDVGECQRLLSHFVDAVAQLTESVTDMEHSIDSGKAAHRLAIADLDETVGSVRQLPVNRDICESLVSEITTANGIAALVNFIAALASHAEAASALSQQYGAVPHYNLGTSEELEEVLDRIADSAPGIEIVSAGIPAARVLETASKSVNEAVDVLRTLSTECSIPLSTTADGAAVAASILAGLATCPVAALQLRHDGLVSGSAAAELAQADAQASSVNKRYKELSSRLDLTLVPSATDLRGHTVATIGARWWSFLKGDFRAARRAYRAMSRGAFGIGQMHADFRELVSLSQETARLIANKQYQAAAGPHLAGLRTPFGKLQSLAQWRLDLMQALAPHGAAAAEAAARVWRLDADTLTRLSAIERTKRPNGVLIAEAVQSLEAVRPILAIGSGAEGDWATLPHRFATTAASLREAIEWLIARGLPGDVRLSERSALLAKLRALSQAKQAVEGSTKVRAWLKNDYRGVETNVVKLRETLDYATVISRASLTKSCKSWLLAEAPVARLDQLKALVESVAETATHAMECWRSFAEFVEVKPAEWHKPYADITTAPLFDIAARAKAALADPDALAPWLDYSRAAERLAGHKLSFLTDLGENDGGRAADMRGAFEFVLAHSLIDAAFRTHPKLLRFSALSHERLRKRFAELDRECIQLYRARAAAITAGRPVPVGVGRGAAADFTELSLLEREIAKQKRHIPLRSLMWRSGAALQALKPCFMMGPLSVAQYLAPGAISFDLLIVDEASQLRPQDALGAIARSAQLVIVGDQMQLPPTSFFDRVVDDDDEEEEASAIEDAESILDVASSLYRPARMLRWHYRSRHGSLIAFSNKEFYKNNLIVFPSPVPKSRSLGVKLVRVQDGSFDSRRNFPEAERIVSAALRHMELHRKETLGIVAMNAPQRELIEDLLFEALRRNPVAEDYVGNPANALEPLFVKNLENVQGDERDVIFISGTYGRTPGGQFHQRFGPINGSTGHRRLNVLFTRARKRVVLFSSMKAEDIAVSPGSSRGVQALKGYLAYAETGVLETALFSGREPDSHFEIEVADALRSRGFDVVAQVGVAGYFLDLAVRHPDKTDAFILGIECDGATYHSSRSARDRDRLRQSVLEGVGWNIHRIWSTEWFKQPIAEVERIVARINAIKSRADATSAALEDWELDPASSSTVDGETWEDDNHAPSLSVDEAREKLLELRTLIGETDESIEWDDSILRDAMMAKLLSKAPGSHEEWLSKIPLNLRLDTNDNHVAAHLGAILEITARLRARRRG